MNSNGKKKTFIINLLSLFFTFLEINSINTHLSYKFGISFSEILLPISSQVKFFPTYNHQENHSFSTRPKNMIDLSRCIANPAVCLAAFLLYHSAPDTVVESISLEELYTCETS